jgi:hypothetical protein
MRTIAISTLAALALAGLDASCTEAAPPQGKIPAREAVKAVSLINAVTLLREPAVTEAPAVPTAPSATTVPAAPPAVAPRVPSAPATPVVHPVSLPATRPVAPAVRQPSRYASIVLENDTEIPLRYAFQWGDGAAAEYTVDPGCYRVHFWAYEKPDQNRSPVPHIRFDYDLSGAVAPKDYSLEAYAAPTIEEADGYTYRFLKSHDGGRVDLYEAE